MRDMTNLWRPIVSLHSNSVSYLRHAYTLVRRALIKVIMAYALCTLVLPPSAHADSLDVYLESIRDTHSLPALAAAVVKDGQLVAAAAVGTRMLGKDIPVTLADRFHIGSNTKAMTATLAGMMVDEGKLRWDSTVGEILGSAVPGMSESLAAATLEQLLSHSSGIPSDNEDILKLYFSMDAFEHDLPQVRLRMINDWKNKETHIPEGTPFQYSNLGYVIAGTMIETVSGTAWEQLMHERLFVPLEITTAGLGAQTTYGLIDAPVGHQIDAEGHITPVRWGPGADVPPSIGPAGNAHMSITDYAKWAAWNAAKGTRPPALLAPETLAYIQSEHVETPVRQNPPPGTPGTGGYGLGWGSAKFDWSERRLLTHNGSNSMNLAKIVIDTEKNLAVVVTTNLPGPKADMAANSVIEKLYTNYSY